MGRILLAIVLVFSLSSPSLSQDRAIEDTISSQIEAFQVDDFERAFNYASPFIQGVFGTHQRFGMMVKNGYPMVWRPAELEFLNQFEDRGFTYQNIRIRDQNGIFHALEYQMISTPDGWRINGVRFIEDPALSA